MQEQQPAIWICSNCWAVMPRVQAELLSARVGQGDAKEPSCRKCGAVGKFVLDSSPEGAGRILDLTSRAWAASLRAAGYEVVAYSAACDRGDHQQCDGKNRMKSVAPKLDSCGCECHQDDTVGPRYGAA